MQLQIEITLKPDGIGKLDIEVNIEKGLINTQINVSEIIGKELLERNLNGFLTNLIDEGLNIGSFSVLLRDKRDNMKGHLKKNNIKTMEANEKVRLSASGYSNGRINIFI